MLLPTSRNSHHSSFSPGFWLSLILFISRLATCSSCKSLSAPSSSLEYSSPEWSVSSKQRCRTLSSSNLHAMAYRINLFVSVISSPRARSLRSVRKESNVSPCSWRLRSNLTAAIIGFFLASRCTLNFSATRSSMSLFTDVMSVFPRSNLNSVPLESEVNLLALVTDEAHQVAYFLFFRALAEWSSESKFAVLIKSFPLFTQVRGGPIHRWPVVRRVSVSFCHIFVLSFIRRRSKSHYSDTMLHINTRPPCWSYATHVFYFMLCLQEVSGIHNKQLASDPLSIYMVTSIQLLVCPLLS